MRSCSLLERHARATLAGSIERRSDGRLVGERDLAGGLAGEGVVDDECAGVAVHGPRSIARRAGRARGRLRPGSAAGFSWYQHHSYLSPTSTTEPAHSEALIDQAAAAGYTGLVFWDSALTFANRPGRDTTHLATVVQYAKSKGLTALAVPPPLA